MADPITEVQTETTTIKQPTYQDRVREEKRELDLKIVKLADFLGSGNSIARNLHVDERLRMGQQLQAMNAYSSILGDRIAAFE